MSRREITRYYVSPNVKIVILQQSSLKKKKSNGDPSINNLFIGNKKDKRAIHMQISNIHIVKFIFFPSQVNYKEEKNVKKELLG